MAILGYLKEHFHHEHLSVHCAEFPYGCTHPAVENRIRDTVDLANPSSLGHALALADNDNMEGLLNDLQQKGIFIETPLSSNSNLGNYTKENHPVKEYWRHHVAVCLATDDGGIFDITMTKEFLQAHKEYGFSYGDLIQLSRNSLHYSTLTGESIYEKDRYGRLEIKQEFLYLYDPTWKPEIDSSAKALKIIQYERSLAVFEAKKAKEWQGEKQKFFRKTFSFLNWNDQWLQDACPHGKFDSVLFKKILWEEVARENSDLSLVQSIEQGFQDAKEHGFLFLQV
jgi:hypothetical protein